MTLHSDEPPASWPAIKIPFREYRSEAEDINEGKAKKKERIRIKLANIECWACGIAMLEMRHISVSYIVLTSAHLMIVTARLSLENSTTQTSCTQFECAMCVHRTCVRERCRLPQHPNHTSQHASSRHTRRWIFRLGHNPISMPNDLNLPMNARTHIIYAITILSHHHFTYDRWTLIAVSFWISMSDDVIDSVVISCVLSGLVCVWTNSICDFMPLFYSCLLSPYVRRSR